MKLKDRICEMDFTNFVNVLVWVITILIMVVIGLLVGFGGTYGVIKFTEYLGKLGG